MMCKIVLASAVLLTTTITYTAPPLMVVESEIAGVHINVYAADNFYDAPFKKLQEWNDVIANVHDFVKEHIDAVQQLREEDNKDIFADFRASTVKRNKELMKNYNPVKTASN